MFKFNSLLFLAGLFSLEILAQSGKDMTFNQSGDSLQIINKEVLDSILTNSTAKVNYLAIYTNSCGGTHYLLQTVNEYIIKYGDDINVILASSAPYKEIAVLKKILRKYNITLPRTYIIDSESYKDKVLDDRKKGYRFRNDICKECRADIIGVPYNIVYDNSKNILFHGYRNSAKFDSMLNSFIRP